jgi:hypothetical protein
VSAETELDRRRSVYLGRPVPVEATLFCFQCGRWTRFWRQTEEPVWDLLDDHRKRCVSLGGGTGAAE